MGTKSGWAFEALSKVVVFSLILEGGGMLEDLGNS